MPAALLMLLSTLGTSCYWKDPRIHNFGNVGVRGMVHALLAPASTRIIDRAAYGGDDLRARVLREHVAPGQRVVDLCCGVGMSSKLGGGVVGIDTSDEMLRVARWLHPEQRFLRGNAEDWGETNAYDVSTCMFAFHEMPRDARRRVLRNMLRLAPLALVVDISPDYAPSALMLGGEPYLLEYQQHVDEDVLEAAAEAAKPSCTLELVHKHATLWAIGREGVG